MWRTWAVVSGVFLGACGSRPVCPPGDLECLAASFSINDFQTYDDTSKRDKLTLLTAGLPTATSTKLSLVIQGALNFPSAAEGMLLLFTWRDDNGCRPSLCMNHCPRGVRCVTGTRCTPSRADGLTQSTTTHWVEYGSDPPMDTDFDLVVTPVSAAGCPTDVAALIELGDASVDLGPGFVIPVHLPAPGGGGGSGVCGSDLHASTLACTPLGTGGVPDTCVTDAEYRSIFGTGLPSTCAPQGTTGCMDTARGALVKPCCPGLTCKVGTACGGTAVVGGTCL